MILGVKGLIFELTLELDKIKANNRSKELLSCLCLQGDEPSGETEDPKPAEDEKAPELKTTKWRVENSWGEEKDKPGYLMMTDNWFTEYVYEVVVDRKHVPEDIMAVLKQDPVVLPAWDPMGSLACTTCGKGAHQAHL